ncbi:hypothetical protein [Pseudomonas sp. O230]|uniref:hypothetical protein n=1 Tax=Pseudomonas sp. O230 TaxID=3159450 RepID=UPI00387A9426
MPAENPHQRFCLNPLRRPPTCLAVIDVLPSRRAATEVAARVEQIDFKNDSNTVKRSDSIKGQLTTQYRLSAKAGQILTVDLEPSNTCADFNITAKGADFALFNSSVMGIHFEVKSELVGGNQQEPVSKRCLFNERSRLNIFYCFPPQWATRGWLHHSFAFNGLNHTSFSVLDNGDRLATGAFAPHSRSTRTPPPR